MSTNNSLWGRLVNWYQTLEPEKRKRFTLGGTAAGFLLLSAAIVTATSPDPNVMMLPKPKKVDYTLFNGKKPRDVTIDALSGRLNKLVEDMNAMRNTFQAQEQKIDSVTLQMHQQNDDINKQSMMANAETRDLINKIGNDKASKVPEKAPLTAGGMGSVPDYPVVPPGQQPVPGQPAVPVTPKIRMVTSAGENASTPGTATAKKKIAEFVNIKKASESGAPDMFLLAGSMVSGTLLTGLDAPTSNQTRDDPFPVLVRIKHQAILPNYYKMDITECFMIASGYGDLSSERAYMRSERLSCIKKDGSVIETAMDAYSVGEDGKTGVRGRVVSKNGQLIGTALLSGFVSGISSAFAPQTVQSLQTSVIPGQSTPYQYPSPQMIGGQALAGGIKGGAKQIAEYYLEMAKNIFPVIEVDAGRKVEFVLIRGVDIKVRQKHSGAIAGGLGERKPSSGNGNALASVMGGQQQRKNGSARGFGGGLTESRNGNYDNEEGFYSQ